MVHDQPSFNYGVGGEVDVFIGQMATNVETTVCLGVVIEEA